MISRLQGVGHELYRHDNGSLVRTIRVKNRVYGVSIRSEGSTLQPLLVADIAGIGSDEELMLVSGHLRRMLSLDADLDGLYDKLEQDDGLKVLADKYNGFRFILESDPFECMVKTIIGQQLNLSFAATLTRRLIETASEPFYIQGREQSYPVFPSPDQVANLKIEQLRALQFSERKAEYVIGFAQEVAQGSLIVEAAELEKLTNEELMERLIPLRGIGRWTVECFLMFGLGRPDLLPAADIGLRNALRNLYKLDHQPTEAEVRAIGANWSPWSSYITYYLWESLNEKGLHG
jgi:DNA-3-methyladenine glycosylase II